MKVLGLCIMLILPAADCWAESGTAESPTQEPSFYDHYLNLQHMQERFNQKTLDEQARLQPQMRRAEREACQQLRKEQQERASQEYYRRQGGNQFVAFALDFERYCEKLR